MSRVVLTSWRGAIVATLPPDVDVEVCRELRDHLAQRVRATRARSVILDTTAVDVMDTEDWAQLKAALATTELLGARGGIAGLQPGVVAALVGCGAATEDVRAFRTVEDAVQALEATA